MKYGLDDDTIQKIRQIFNKYETVDEVKLYGSRAKGNFKNGSDIDLTVKGTISQETLSEIRSDLDDLNFPYTFDLSLFSEIDNHDLIDHINRVGETFYMKAKT